MIYGTETHYPKRRGYVDTGRSVISEFYTPLVPKRYDFIEEIEKMVSD
jgi:hypothetical protein